MPHSLSRLAVLKNDRLRELIAFALREGWQVKLTPRGNIQLRRKGFTPIYNAAYLLEKAEDKLREKIKNPRKINGGLNV